MHLHLLRGLAELVKELTELPLAALSSALNFPLESIADNVDLVPLSQISTLLEECARLTGVDHLGALLAKQQGLVVLGPMLFEVQHCHFLQQALETIARHHPQLGYGWRTQLVQRANVAMLELPSLPRQLQLWLATHWTAIFQQLTAGRMRPSRLFLSHSSSTQASQLRELLAVSTHYQVHFNGFLCHEDLLQLALPHSARQQFALLHQAQDVTEPTCHGYHCAANRAEHIRALMDQQLLLEQRCNLTTVAAALQRSPRTVQYYLQQQGLSFQQLLDEAREHYAIQQLLHSKLTISRISVLLGFADTSVFSRRFRLWTGQSPRQFRQQRAGRSIAAHLST